MATWERMRFERIPINLAELTGSPERVTTFDRQAALLPPGAYPPSKSSVSIPAPMQSRGVSSFPNTPSPSLRHACTGMLYAMNTMSCTTNVLHHHVVHHMSSTTIDTDLGGW
jgi:hypothetical protein